MPAEPCRSKKADCGLNTATSVPSASTTVIANRSSPAGCRRAPTPRQQARVRVDADAQRAAGVHRVAQPGTEGFHRGCLAFLVVHAVVVRVGVDVGDRGRWVVGEADRLAELADAARGELATQLAR